MTIIPDSTSIINQFKEDIKTRKESLAKEEQELKTLLKPKLQDIKPEHAIRILELQKSIGENRNMILSLQGYITDHKNVSNL